MEEELEHIGHGRYVVNEKPQDRPIVKPDPCSIKFFYCCCEVPEIEVIKFRERPITLIFTSLDQEYEGPRSKMVPVRRCVTCGGYPRKRCPECSFFEYELKESLNNYCHSCRISKYSLFEKVRTLDEGMAIERRFWDREISISDVRWLKPTSEQLDAFLEVRQSWKDKPLNSYRKSQLQAFAMGWNYVEKIQDPKNVRR